MMRRRILTSKSEGFFPIIAILSNVKFHDKIWSKSSEISYPEFESEVAIGIFSST